MGALKQSKVKELAEFEVQHYIDLLDEHRKAQFNLWKDNCIAKGYKIKYCSEGYAVWAEVRGNKTRPYVIYTSK